MRTSHRILAAIAIVALGAAGCSSTSSTSVATANVTPAATVAARTSAAAAGPTDPSSASDSLMVLGDGVQGGMGLWRFDAPSKWTSSVATKGASAIAPTPNGLVVVVGQTIEERTSSDPSKLLAAVTLKWPSAAPGDPIVAVDRAPGGKVAFVTSDGTRAAYYVAAADGTVAALQPAPSQSFTPLVAWLDDTRLLVLSTEKDQVSRLAVVDTAAGTITQIKTIAGIAFFAVSADRLTLAAGTEGDIFVAPVSDWLAAAQPHRVTSVGAGRVMWGLALDKSGTRLAALTGAASTDGQVGAIHETGYVNSGATWTQAFDSPAPMATPKGQVWLP